MFRAMRRSWEAVSFEVCGRLSVGWSGTYKTQTVGGLDGLSGTGVPFVESWRTW